MVVVLGEGVLKDKVEIPRNDPLTSMSQRSSDVFWFRVVMLVGLGATVYWFWTKFVSQSGSGPNLVLELDSSDPEFSPEAQSTALDEIKTHLQIYVDGEQLEFLGPPYGIAWGFRSKQLSVGEHTIRVVLISFVDNETPLFDRTWSFQIVEGRRHRIRIGSSGDAVESDD